MSELERFAQRVATERGFSRNRRFDEFARPEARRLMRRLRRLQGIKHDLAGAGTVTMCEAAGGFTLTLAFPAVRARRETFLRADEVALLRRDGLLAAPGETGAG